MDDLNAQQIVLLTLLVSFVTSIATGITTVSLLEQAPDPVTQTINRVVEKTVERVVTEPSEDKIIEKEVVTVVVNEEDLTIEAVEKNSRSLVRIYDEIGDLRNFVAIGVVVNARGDVVTDGNKVVTGEEYVGVYQSGEFDIVLNDRVDGSNLASLSITGTTTETFVPAVFADSDSIRLGQSVISLSGEEKNLVSTGIINSLNTTTEGLLSSISTSVNGGNVITGSVVLNLQGEIIGIKLFNSTSQTTFLPSNDVADFLISDNLSFSQAAIEEETE